MSHRPLTGHDNVYITRGLFNNYNSASYSNAPSPGNHDSRELGIVEENARNVFGYEVTQKVTPMRCVTKKV